MKDIATPVGIVLGLVIIVAANVLEGGNPMSLLLLPPILLVLGTTLMVTVAGGTMVDAKAAVSNVKRAISGSVEPADTLVPQVVTLAERARREGLLALEDSLREIDDPFLVKGVTMAIDGTDPEDVRDRCQTNLCLYDLFINIQ